MLLSKNKSIEDLVCTELQHGPLDKVTLIERIKKERPKTTKQGVYNVLRSLRNDDVVVIHSKKVSFNVKWLKQMDKFFTTAEQYYTDTDFVRGSFINLKDKEKITYSFSNASETDKFWGHALIILAESFIPNNEPVYIYNPHEWFLIARKNSERECFSLITKRRRLLVTVGGKTYLDSEVSKEFDHNMSQYHMLSNPMFSKNNYYFNIIGDFIIEVYIDKIISRLIENFYSKTENLNDEKVKELINIVENKGKSRLIISRDFKKADKLKKSLRKNFYIPIVKNDKELVLR